MPLPSVSKLFNAVVAPELLAMGFAVDGKRYWRVKGNVFQAVFLHVETRIRREFILEYCTFLICVPHAFYTLDHGGRFPVGTRGTSYPADTPERLETSIARVQAGMPALLEWFKSSESLEGYLRTYQERVAKQPPPLVTNGHTAFALACAYAAAGDLESARPNADRSLSEFEKLLASYLAAYPSHDHWAPEWIERTRSLIAAIDASSTDALLEEWRVFTASALKLS